MTFADLIIWLLISLVIISSIYPLYVYATAFLMAITYIYCKRRPHEEFSLMFGFKVKSTFFIIQAATSHSFGSL